MILGGRTRDIREKNQALLNQNDRWVLYPIPTENLNIIIGEEIPAILIRKSTERIHKRNKSILEFYFGNALKYSEFSVALLIDLCILFQTPQDVYDYSSAFKQLLNYCSETRICGAPCNSDCES